MKWWSICALALSLSLVHGSETASESSFRIKDGLIWIHVTTPRSPTPLNFLLDSGANVSVINLNTARRLGVDLGARVSVRGVKSTSAGYWPQRLSASLAGVKLPQEYLALDLQDLSRACSSEIDGLLGTDFFRQHIVQIDFVSQKLRLLKIVEKSTDAETLPLELRRCGMRVPIRVDGGKPQWVRLDTGCSSSLQWVTSGVQPKNCTRQMAVGLSEISIPSARTTVQLGGITFESVPTGFHKKEIFAGESGLLGNGLLSRLQSVTVDAKGGRVILKKSSS